MTPAALYPTAQRSVYVNGRYLPCMVLRIDSTGRHVDVVIEGIGTRLTDVPYQRVLARRP